MKKFELITTNKIKRTVIPLLITSLVLFFISGCNQHNAIVVQTYEEYARAVPVTKEHLERGVEGLVSDEQDLAISNTDLVIEHEISEVSILGVGDLMFHRAQLTRSYDYDTDTFDFSDSFANVRSYIEAADFAVGNLETTLAGEDGSRRFRVDQRVGGYSGYPAFNTPDILVDTLLETGFDLVSTANNHSLDSYDAGLFRTIDVLDEKGLGHVGTYKTEDEANETYVEMINGMSFAFVNYTYGMNGFEPDEGYDFIINDLNIYDPIKVEELNQRVRDADDMGVDFVIVMMHWGNEYFENENNWQQDVTDGLFDNGADVIFGGHPHVLQPIEIHDIEEADGTSKKGIVIYSLGNFLSSQIYSDGDHKDLGVMMSVHFTMIDTNAFIDGFTLVPTYTYRHDDSIGIYPVNETLAMYESGQIELSDHDYNRLTFSDDYTVSHLLSYIPQYEVIYNNYEYFLSFDKQE